MRLRRLGGILSFVLTFLVAFEVVSLVAIRTGALPAPVPKFIPPGEQQSWIEVHPQFGVWHPPNTRYVHATSCFNVVYRSNSVGMRDPERPREADEPRVAFFGDSFVEGYGLDRGERISDLLEAGTSVPHLNFGSAGSFGPTEQLLVYRHLASGFRHDGVILGLLPDNDFLDDDPAFAHRVYAGEYRPYLKETPEGFRLEYSNPEALRLAPAEWELGLALRRWLRSYSHGANAVGYVRELYLYASGRDAVTEARDEEYAGYFDYTPSQWERLEFTLDELLGEIGDRPVLIVLFPRPADIARENTGTGAPPLVRDLREHLRDRDHVTLLDLLPAFRGHRDLPSLFNACDGHLTREGARLVSEEIRTEWNLYEHLAGSGGP